MPAALAAILILFAGASVPVDQPAVPRHERALAEHAMTRRGTGWHVAPLITTFGGQRTACGLRLHVWTVGVAHRRLPCGTLIRFIDHGHRSPPIPVIDRGPWPRMVGLPNRLIPFDVTHRACRLIRGHPGIHGCGTQKHVRWRIVGWRRLK